MSSKSSRSHLREAVMPRPSPNRDRAGQIGASSALVSGGLLQTGEEWLGLACAELAGLLRLRLRELVEIVFDYVRKAVPDEIADGDPQLAHGLREAICACAECALVSIEESAPWSGPLPQAISAQARRDALGGVSVQTLLSRCAASYALALNVIFEEVTRQGLGERQTFVLVLHVSALLGWLLALVQAEIGSVHSAELSRTPPLPGQRRDELVRRMLDGNALSAGERTELGYDLNAWHVCVIGIGAQAEAAVRALASVLGCELLLHEHTGEIVSGWLGARRRVRFAEIERAIATLGRYEVRFVCGEPAWGPQEWRKTHREAHAASLVALYNSKRLTRYLDVAPEATALQDDALGDSLIQRYLAPLEGMHIGAQAARRTLRALFDAEHNITAAASALKLHRSTVHRQRNEIEQRLDCRLAEHQVDIEIAVRVAETRERRAQERSTSVSTIGNMKDDARPPVAIHEGHRIG